MNIFQKWTVAHASPAGLPLKRATGSDGTREQAQEAARHDDLIALPSEILDQLEAIQKRMIQAEQRMKDFEAGTIAEDITEMICSLHTSIIQAGGGGLSLGMLDWPVKKLIKHLASNNVRFHYVGP